MVEGGAVDDFVGDGEGWVFRVFGVVDFFVERVLFDVLDAGVVGEFSECGEVVFACGG